MASKKSSLVPKNVKNPLFSTGIANFPAEEFTQGVVLVSPPKESDQLLAKDVGGEVDTFLGQNVTDFAIGQIAEADTPRKSQQPLGPILLPPPPPTTCNFKAAPSRISVGRPPDQAFLPVEPLSQSEPDFKQIPLDDSIPLYNPKSVLNSIYQAGHELNRIVPPLESGVHLYDPSCAGAVLPPHATKRPLSGRVDHSPLPNPVIPDPAFSSLSKHISTYSPSLVIDSGSTESATPPEASRKSSSSSSANELSSTLTNSQDYRTSFLPSSSSTSSLYSNALPNNLKSPALLPQTFHQSASTPSLYHPPPSNSSGAAKIPTDPRKIDSAHQTSSVPLYSSAPSLSNNAPVPPNSNSQLPVSSTFPPNVPSGVSLISPSPVRLYPSAPIPTSYNPFIPTSEFAPTAPPETLSSVDPCKNNDNSISNSTFSPASQITAPICPQALSISTPNNYNFITNSVISSEPEAAQTTANPLSNSDYSISSFLNQLNPFKRGSSPSANSVNIKSPPPGGSNDLLLSSHSNSPSINSDPLIPQPVKSVTPLLPTPPESRTPASVGASLPPPPLTGFQVSSTPLTSLPNIHHSILANSNPYSITSKKKAHAPVLKPEHYFTPIPVDELSKPQFEESTQTSAEVGSQQSFLSSPYSSDITQNTVNSFTEDYSNSLQEKVALIPAESCDNLTTQLSHPYSSSDIEKEKEEAVNTHQLNHSISPSSISDPSLIQPPSSSSAFFLPPPPLSGFQASSTYLASRISPKVSNVFPEHLPPLSSSIAFEKVPTVPQLPAGTTNQQQPIASPSELAHDLLKLSRPSANIDSEQDSVISHHSSTTFGQFSVSIENKVPLSSESTRGEELAVPGLSSDFIGNEVSHQPLQPSSSFHDKVPLFSYPSCDTVVNSVPLLPNVTSTDKQVLDSSSAPPPIIENIVSFSDSSAQFIISTDPQVPLPSSGIPLPISSEISPPSFSSPPINRAVTGPPISPSQPNSYRLSSLKKRPTYAPVPDLGHSHKPSVMAYHQESLNNVDQGDLDLPSVQPPPSCPLDTPPPGSHTAPTYQPFIAMAVSQTYRPVYHHWFHKDSKKNQWFPFSMADSLNLEQQFSSDLRTDESKLIGTDGGRYDVDVEARKRKSVYWHEDEAQVRRCSWFVKGPVDSRYQPYDENIAALLEEEYKTACTKNEWNRRVELADGEVIILHSPNAIAHHQRSSSPDPWGNPPPMQEKPRTVKRGLDEFDIPEGEPTQVDHLLLLVHGIGKVCDLRFRSLVEVVDDFRNVSVSLVGSHYKSAVERGRAGRVEVLPVEWHRALHTEAIDRRLADITLPSIPRAREFTNETLLDILFYTSPVFCERIVQAVGEEVNRVYSLYLERNPGYKGGVSLGGHSLGSLILFDMLCHQKPPHPKLQSTPSFSVDEADEDISSLGCLKTRARLSRRMSYVTIGTAGTGQPYIVYPQLRFQPRAFFALGSPIGMFVTVRGIESLGEDFRFPTCPSFFNIFHPNDPVAYRIEGLINPEMAHHPAVLIPHHKGRKRMHLELKETMAHVTAALKQKLLDSVKNTWNTVSSLTRFSKMDPAAIENQVDKVIEDEMMCKEDSSSSVGESAEAEAEGVELKVGQLNGGRRIDHVLQEAPLETFNQYISAVRSHLVYWESEDTMLLILKEIYSAKGVTADCQVPQPILPFDMSPEANADPGTAYSHYTVSTTPPPSRQNTIAEEPL